MTDRHDSSRRRALAQLSAGSLATLAPWALAQAQAPITVGVIYVGPRDDYGYNQAQAQAAAEVKKMPGVKVVEEENVPETAAVQKTMTGMIRRTAPSCCSRPRSATSIRTCWRVAPKNPDVRFSHCGGLWTEGKHPKNIGSFFGYIDECQYLNGVIAGHMTQEQQDRLRRRQADPAGAAQHQRLHHGRALGQPEASPAA